MLNYIDKKLNIVTMYRLTLYYLVGLLVWACVLGYFGLISYPPLAIIISVMYIGFFSWITNWIFSKIFKVPANVESVYITVLILVFIITPIRSFSDLSFYSLAAWAGMISMASKYILAVKKKHLFNPAAIAVVVTSFGLGLSASWWVGTTWMAVPVLAGGLLLTRKILRGSLLMSFFLTSLLVIIVMHGSAPLLTSLIRFALTSSTLFFAFVMLTEPRTIPSTKNMRMVYGALVGFLSVPSVHFGSYYLTPEIALILGNIFSYVVSPKEYLVLRLHEIKQVGTNIYDLVFEPVKNFNFKPGEYMEWTLPGKNSDNRGNRRYFTIASSPTESMIRLGVKSYDSMSTFKQKLLSLKPGDVITASQRAGDFVLPDDPNKKIVLIAGGIGVTPFRSMLKSLIDTQEKRDISIFYSNKIISEIVYTDVFDAARDQLGIQIIYTLTDTNSIPSGWSGERGVITKEILLKYLPEINNRYFYISGPHSMVTTFQDTLSQLGVKSSHIKTDFFPGLV